MSTIKATNLKELTNGVEVPVNTVVNGTAKAWVNFNGTGTVAIRKAFNVSSITDGGTGIYTVNFTSAMSDTNFCVVCSGRISSTNPRFIGPESYLTNNIQIITEDSAGAAVDFDIVNVAVFG